MLLTLLKGGTAAPPSSQLFLRVGVTYRSGTLWQRIAGTWRSGQLWQRVAGTWR